MSVTALRIKNVPITLAALGVALAIVACGDSAAPAITAAPAAEPTVVAATVRATVPPGRTQPADLPAPAPRVAAAAATAVPTTPPAPPVVTVAAATPQATTAPTEVAAPSGADPAAGRELFTANACVACHGVNLEGGIGPKLAGRSLADLTDERIRTQVSDGGGAMPPFPQLTDEQVTHIMEFIRSMK